MAEVGRLSEGLGKVNERREAVDARDLLRRCSSSKPLSSESESTTAGAGN